MSDNLSDRARSVNKYTHDRALIPPPHASESPTGFTEADGIHDQIRQRKYQADAGSARNALHRNANAEDAVAGSDPAQGATAGDRTPASLHAETGDREARRAISANTKSVNDALAPLGAPLIVQAYLRAHIGLSDGQEHYRASDLEIGQAAHRGTAAPDEKDQELIECSNNSLRKWTQRARNATLRFEERLGIALAKVIEPGHMEGKTKVKTRYRLHVWGFIEKVSRAAPRDRRKLAFKLLTELQAGKSPPAPPPELTPKQVDERRERELNRDRATILTLTRKTARTIKESGGDPRAFVNKLTLQMIETVRAEDAVAGSDPTQGATKKGSQNAASVMPDVAKNANPRDPLLSSMKRDIVDTPEPSSPPVSPLPPRESRDTGGDAEATLQAFESVGVTEFQVTLKDELAGAALDCETYTGACLRAFLPGLLKRNAERAESIIVRPRKHGPGLIQADDLTGAEIEKVRPLAFFIAETSHQNFQAWFDVTDADETTRRRLLLALNADRGASGAMRLPGSRNMKPLRDGFPIRLVATAPGRQVCVADLERAGLLAPLPCPPQPTVERPRPMTRAPRFPDYARCLADKDDNRSNADAAFVRIAMREGFTASEAWAELERVAPREKLQRADYRRRTLSFCSAP